MFSDERKGLLLLIGQMGAQQFPDGGQSCQGCVTGVHSPRLHAGVGGLEGGVERLMLFGHGVDDCGGVRVGFQQLDPQHPVLGLVVMFQEGMEQIPVGHDRRASHGVDVARRDGSRQPVDVTASGGVRSPDLSSRSSACAPQRAAGCSGRLRAVPRSEHDRVDEQGEHLVKRDAVTPIRRQWAHQLVGLDHRLHMGQPEQVQHRQIGLGMATHC